MTTDDIKSYLRNVVYKDFPEYVIEIIALENPIRFYVIIHITETTSYCFILLIKNEANNSDSLKISPDQIKEFEELKGSSNCLFKRVLIIIEKENGSLTHTTDSLDKYKTDTD